MAAPSRAPAAGATPGRARGTRGGRARRASRCGRRPSAAGPTTASTRLASSPRARPLPGAAPRQCAAGADPGHGARRGTLERLGRAQDPRPVGHGPLQPVARLGHVVARHRLVRVAGELGHRPRAGPRRRRASSDVDTAMSAARRRPGPAARPVGSGPSRPVLDGLGQPGPEHHALEQRVRGQPVGPVHAGAGALPRRPQPGQGAGPVEVGDHAARQVVGGGRDRAASSRPGRARPPRTDAAIVGNRSSKASRPVASSHRCSTCSARPCGRPWPG